MPIFTPPCSKLLMMLIAKGHLSDSHDLKYITPVIITRGKKGKKTSKRNRPLLINSMNIKRK